MRYPSVRATVTSQIAVSGPLSLTLARVEQAIPSIYQLALRGQVVTINYCKTSIMINEKMASSKDYKAIAARVNSHLRFKIPEIEIRAAFDEFDLPSPTPAELASAIECITSERSRVIREILDHLVVVCHVPPSPSGFGKLIRPLKVKVSRSVRLHLLAMVTERNASKWAQLDGSGQLIRVELGPGEMAMVTALTKTFGVTKRTFPSILLRTFAYAVMTGKINLTDVPRLSASLSDNDLGSFAQSPKFASHG